MIGILPVVCFIGAAVRLLFYRIIGRKGITMKYLTGKDDEQQIASISIGLIAILLFGFVIVKIL